MLSVLLRRSENCCLKIQAVVEAGGVEIMHKAMKQECEPIRFEASWILTNLLSGSSEQASKVLKSGCLATLVELINSDESWNVKEHAVWVLGNIAGDSPSCREKVLAAGGMTAILTHIQEDSLTYMRTASWSLRNLMLGSTPQSSYTQLMPFIFSHLSTATDSEIRCSLFKALSYIAESTVQDVIGFDHITCEMLVEEIAQYASETTLPALQAIGFWFSRLTPMHWFL